MIKTQDDLNKVVNRAIHDRERIQSSPYKWATLEIEFFTFEIIIRVTSGVTLSDGEQERANCTRYYTMDQRGKVHVDMIAHT